MEEKLLLISLLVMLSLVSAMRLKGESGFLPPDSQVYLRKVKILAGEEKESFIHASTFLGWEFEWSFERLFRAGYSLLLLPFYLHGGRNALVSPSLLFGALTVPLLFRILSKAGLGRLATAGALFLLFSRQFALLSSTVRPDVPALFFGWLFFLLWLEENKKWASLPAAAALLIRESTLGIVMAALLIDLAEKRPIYWAAPLTALLLLFSPALRASSDFAWEIYAKALPESDTASTLQSVLNNLFEAAGLLVFFAAAAIFGKGEWNRAEAALLLVVALHAIGHVAWPTSHPRYWLGAMPAIIFFSLDWLRRNFRDREALALSAALLLVDPSLSLLAWLPSPEL